MTEASSSAPLGARGTGASAGPPVNKAQRGERKVRVGTVVSDKMDKTVVVAVEDVRQHRLYKKRMRRTTKLKAHDEQNAAGVGDLVRLAETRPLSATKRWRVVEIIQKAR